MNIYYLILVICCWVLTFGVGMLSYLEKGIEHDYENFALLVIISIVVTLIGVFKY